MTRLFLIACFATVFVGIESLREKQTILDYLSFSMTGTGTANRLSAKDYNASNSSSKTTCQSTGAPFTESERQIFIDKHNAYRSQLSLGKSQLPDGTYASSASDMYKMIYDCSLEKIAQGWANNCKFQHSPYTYRNAGENIYALYTGTAGDWRNTIISEPSNVWWAELKQYGGITKDNVNLTTDVFNKGIGHWSQMAWSKSTTLGCGWAECPQDNDMIMHLVVCNYRPTGNYLNENIYKIGNSCSSCSQLPNSKCEVNTGLCFA
ncbi:hypothetical protein FO519_001622 [Halicephalobus sp. NKZ332]|nr:hypothetical protein FO519_001622 [Halicephalobus sp. NKZ332]